MPEDAGCGPANEERVKVKPLTITSAGEAQAELARALPGQRLELPPARCPQDLAAWRTLIGEAPESPQIVVALWGEKPTAATLLELDFEQWQARAELQLGDPETAWRTLSFFDDDGPERPYWGGAWVNLTRGRILDVLGERERAVVQYKRVLDYRSPQGSRRASELARLALEEPFQLEQPVTMSPAESG